LFAGYWRYPLNARGHALADSAGVTALANLQRNIDVIQFCGLKVHSLHSEKPESNNPGFFWMLRARKDFQRYRRFNPNSN
jgi:hypothetical protein